MDDGIFELLYKLSNSYNSSLKSLNNQLLISYDNYTVRIKKTIDEMSSLSKSVESIIENGQTLSKLNDSFLSQYRGMFSSSDFEVSIPEQLIDPISKWHVSIIKQFNQFAHSNMLDELKKCFVNTNYNSFSTVLNHSLSSSLIKASDFAFFKTTKIVKEIGEQLIFPQGFERALKTINQVTADALSKNNRIEYDTRNNRFISFEGQADTKVINIICACKQALSCNKEEFITEEELIDFNTFLSMTPMLGLDQEPGRKIRDYIHGLFISGEKTMDFDNDIYYHTRARKKDEMPFTFYDLLKAPHGLPWNGRYNHVGISHYYFSNTKEGAESEVRKHLTNNDIMQTVIIKPIKRINLLDLSGLLKNGTTFLRYLRFPLSDVTNKTPREYLIPCFVADCCKSTGFDGVKYFGSPSYDNYVVWNDGYFKYVGMA